jgi:hypothetical protein
LRVCEDRENMINVRNYTFEEAYQLWLNYIPKL